MVDIIINGACGKMGRVLADIICQREDCRVTAGVDVNGSAFADFPVWPTYQNLHGDVMIDFSHPDALDDLLAFCCRERMPVVIATTGYSLQQIEKIQRASKQTPVFFSFNMSMGINLLSALARQAVSVLGDEFDVEIIEKHHNQKIDAPSGTAILLADAINRQAGGKYEYVYDRRQVRQKRQKKELGIHSVRGGSIVGEHEVIFAGRDEILSLSHSARSKEIFAVGAVNAAMFLANRSPGIYDMNALIEQK